MSAKKWNSLQDLGMKTHVLYYRFILFFGLAVSAVVVYLFKNFERELAAQIASVLFLFFGGASIEVGRRLKDKILILSGVLFMAASVVPILVIKYILNGPAEWVVIFHKIGNLTFFIVNLVALGRLFKLRLKAASVSEIRKD